MKTLKVVEQKDITPIEDRVKSLSVKVSTLKITSKKSLEIAKEELKQVGAAKNWVKDQKAKLVDPISLSLKNARAFFKPLELRIEEAEHYLKGSIMDYKRKIDEQAKKKEEEVQKKIEEGEISFEKASEKIERAESKKDDFNVRKQKVIKVVDENEIPREYMMPNLTKIKNDAFAGKEIAGVKVVIREIPVIR